MSDRNTQGQAIAWISAVIQELPRAGVDIDRERVQEFLSKESGRTELRKILWRALATRRIFKIRLEVNNFTKLILKRNTNLDEQSVELLAKRYPQRVVLSEEANIELVRFDHHYDEGQALVFGGYALGLEQPRYEDALAFLEQHPVNIFGKKDLAPIVFPHEGANLPDYRAFGTDERLRLEPRYGKWFPVSFRDERYPPGTWFAFRSPAGL